jgi:acetolactate synthase-1/2/3 large subunit
MPLANLLSAGRPRLLMASGMGEHTGGGLALWDGEALEEVDRISSCGLALDRGRLARGLYADGLAGRSTLGEVAVYDEHGLARYLRLDGVSDLHDVAWDGDRLMVVSTGTNAIAWVDAGGDVRRTWQAPGHNDAWHLNCVARREGRWYAMAFCRAPDHRAWWAPSQRDAGVLFDLETQETVVEGLRSPHTPRWADGAWLVANSAAKELAAFDHAGGRLLRRADAGGWTRGLTVSDEYVFVGVSAQRGEEAAGRAHIAVLDRRTWQPAGRIELPWLEVYDVLLVPPAIAEGVRRGCRTNPLRVAEAARHSAPDRVPGEPLWPECAPLTTGGARVGIEIELPSELEAGGCVELPCVVTNRGTDLLSSEPPSRTELTYKWLDAETREWAMRDASSPLISVRSRLPQPLAPGASAPALVRVESPQAPRRMLLVVTLYDERVGWLDDLDPASGTSRVVEVTAPPAATALPARPGPVRALDWRGVPSATERRVLTAPAPVARAAAKMATLPEQRWILCQPREVRRSFAEEVFGHPDEERRQQIWMLRQARDVRESYIQQVLLAE